MPKNYIMTWFYAEQQGEESFYPQVAELSSSMKFQEVYWRCVVGHFATSARQNPDCHSLFFTNVPKDALPIVDGQPVGEVLRSLKVEVVNLPLVYQTPDDFFHEWRSQFYIFGIFKYLTENHTDEGNNYILLDSDCAWVRPAAPLFKEISENGVLMYEIPYAEAHMAHGLSRLDMKDIYEEMLGTRLDFVPRYFGGEVQAMSLGAMKKLMADYDWVWETSLQRNTEGKKKFTMEAFVLSFLYHKHGFTNDGLDKYIRRIWTVDHHYTAKPSDLDLTIWHMPTEKKSGFRQLYGDILDKSSPFWTTPTGPDFVKYMSGVMQIPHRSFTRLVKHQLRKVRNNLKSTFTPA